MPAQNYRMIMNRKLQNITLIHEHMSIDLSEGDLGSDSYDLLCEELTSIYAMDVRRIVDMTTRSWDEM